MGYDRCIDQNTSVTRTDVGRRSSPTGAIGDLSTIILVHFDFGIRVQFDKTNVSHQQLKQRSRWNQNKISNYSAAIKNIQPCKLYPGDHAFPGTAAAQLPRRRRATSAETKAKDSDPNMSFLHVSRRTRRACKLSRGSVRAPIVSLVSLVLFCSPVALAHCFAP